ncbi:MAG: hypothetical protein AAF682_07235 [Planctomycetota bacterium]
MLRPLHGGLAVLLYDPAVPNRWEAYGSTSELLAATTLGHHPGEVVAGSILNSRGFRTHEYADVPDADAYRIVVLGDSFAFSCGGVPYRSHWPVVLERELEAASDRDVDALSLGVPGVGPLFLQRMWQVEGARLNPDLVVLSFFVGNDFTDSRGDVVDASTLDRWARQSLVLRLFRNGLRRRGGVATSEALESVWKVRPAPPGAPPGIPLDEFDPRYVYPYDPSLPSFTEDAYLATEARRMTLCVRASDALFQRFLEPAVEVLSALQAEVEAGGAELLVMVIPDEYQIDPELARSVAKRMKRPLSDFDLQRPQRELIRALEERGVRTLDLLPDLREASQQEPVYALRNTHWNQVGSRVAAERLAEVVRERADFAR